MAEQRKDELRLGFLTAIELPDRGWVGGLLVTNKLGRPLEFQCTTPVKPNRTQEILYGPTLRGFVLGEVIGRTLVDRTSVKPDLLLTESAEMLDVRDHVAMPAACVAKDDESPQATSVRLGRQSLRFHDAHGDDRRHVESRRDRVPEEADLREPFERIREALEETLRTVSR